MCVCVCVPGSHLTKLISFLEEASIVGENETYPRALLHWNRAASQGTFGMVTIPVTSDVRYTLFFFLYEARKGRKASILFNISHIPQELVAVLYSTGSHKVIAS